MSQNLEKLKSLLAELFQLDHAELDFGIYRIMNARRDEIERFLKDELLPQVREVLSAHAAFDIEAAESEVFSHLYNFFRRYYSDGDFISQRRYKEGVYAIPYEGEEVKLYWANYDQYYIKTSEYFRDYTFKLPNGKRVHFKLVEADTEKDNNRPQNGKERRFILSEKQPLAVENGELVIRFEYRPDPEKRKQADLNAEAVERITNSPEWSSLQEEQSTEKGSNRTLLEKHLADYTARNTFDYFIHKDLGGFLRRELDFYIKNEVMHLDDIENETAPRVEQYLAKVKAIRQIAHKIIDFLAQLENFQEKLWLKKKFVVETQYCVTLDRVPEELYPEIAANEEQRKEWVRLFAINELQGDLTKPGCSEPLTVEFLKANPYLVLDTRHFDKDFKRRLLASFNNLDEQCDGLLIHSENFQALNLLLERYRGQVKCVYIDPPYNTDQDRQTGKFLYKNAYEHSTWLTMMTNRLSLDAQLLHQEGAHFVSTDENELHRLVSIIMGYGRKYHGLFTWRRTRTGGHLSSAFNQLSDYVVVSTNPSGDQLFGGQADPDESQPLVKASNLRKELRFPAGSIEFLDKQSGIIPAGTKGTGANPVSCLTDIEIVDGKNVSEVVLSGPFVWTQQRLESELAAGARIVVKRAVSLNPRFFRIPRGHKPFPSLADDHFPVGTNEDGSEELESILGPGHGFTYPKPVLLIQRIVQSKSFFDKNLTVLDYFAGSGTTAHAVINLNREDGGRRKYILVEMGEYFDTILVPRIKKVVYSKDWKDGKPVSREGISHMFKYIRLESYEDTLNNLKLERTEQQNKVLFPNDPKEYSERKSFREDYILHYMLDVESRGSLSLLNLDRFEDPFNYKLNIATGTAGETKPTAVDLVETFNYLIGLRVKTIRYLDGVCVVTGTNPQGERVLILWRNAKEIDNDKLDDWFQKQGYNAKDQEFDAIYVNGDNNLENLKGPNQTWKVRLIEEEFLRRMFDVQDV